MTPEQRIQEYIILDYYSDPDNKEIVQQALTKDNIEQIYEELNGDYELQDCQNEFRYRGYTTDIESEDSRYYESESHAFQFSDGVWVGWTYWYGGGNHSNPDEIDWMDSAYFLDCKTYEKTVTIQEFTKSKLQTKR